MSSETERLRERLQTALDSVPATPDYGAVLQRIQERRFEPLGERPGSARDWLLGLLFLASMVGWLAARVLLSPGGALGAVIILSLLGAPSELIAGLIVALPVLFYRRAWLRHRRAEPTGTAGGHLTGSQIIADLIRNRSVDLVRNRSMDREGKSRRTAESRPYERDVG